jgi:molybdopterin-guanine dinucleotide biosynthesis protein A
VIVAVLAGGAGRRLGGAKPGALLAGRPLLSYPLASARGAGLEAFVVAKHETPLPAFGEALVTEPAQPLHPLAGVLAALGRGELMGAEAVVCTACDMPFVTSEMLGWLASLDGPVAIRARGRLQPLPVRWPVAAAGAAASALAAQEPLMSTVAALDPAIIDEAALSRFGDPERLLANVNDGHDLAAAERLLDAPGR